jgi:glycosyltransferase involved in cell wall biosynthesis
MMKCNLVIEISIVTVAKNHAEGLAKTLASIRQLAGMPVELILVIAQSDDATLQIAQEFCVDAPFPTSLILQNGTGIYAAMNIGLEKSKGSSILFMNAGDRFVDKESFEKLAWHFNQSGMGLAVGGYHLEDLDGKRFVYSNAKLSQFKFAFSRHGGCHQSILYKNDALKFFKGFSEDLQIVADFEVNLRIIKSFGGIRSSSTVSIIEPGGGGDQEIFQLHRLKHKVRKEVFDSLFVEFISLIWTLLAHVKVAASKVRK